MSRGKKFLVPTRLMLGAQELYVNQYEARRYTRSRLTIQTIFPPLLFLFYYSPRKDQQTSSAIEWTD